MQAAVGVAQLGKLGGFIAARRHNWTRLRQGMADLEHLLLLPEPTPSSDPSWFGFAITVRASAPFQRSDLVAYLEDHRIATRLLFGSNLVRQPAFKGHPYRIVGSLANADLITEGTFWIGVYPGITDEMIDYMLDVLHEFAQRFRR